MDPLGLPRKDRTLFTGPMVLLSSQSNELKRKETAHSLGSLSHSPLK